MANALEENKVTFFPHFLILSRTHYFIQTLRTLNLPWNHIGDQGTQYLAYVLQENKVIFFSRFLILSLIRYFTQTLITLDLLGRNISDDGKRLIKDIEK